MPKNENDIKIGGRLWSVTETSKIIDGEQIDGDITIPGKIIKMNDKQSGEGNLSIEYDLDLKGIKFVFGTNS